MLNDLIVLIPAFNEAKTVGEIVKRSQQYTTRIIVIDDGSSDDTANICRSLGVTVIRNNRRMGKGLALKRGLIEALRYGFEVAVILDGDGQHNPDDIPRLANPIKRLEADIVIGSRYTEEFLKEIPRTRRYGLSVINRLNSYLIKSRIKDSQSGFRAYARNAVEKVLSYSSTGYGVETEQLAMADLYGFRIIEVPVRVTYEGLDHTSKMNSFYHGIIIVFTIVRIVLEKRSLLIFGLSGLILLFGAIATAVEIMVIFNDTRYFSIPLSLIALGLTFIGSLLILISFILYALKKIRQT